MKAADKRDFERQYVVYSPSRNMCITLYGHDLTDSIIYFGVFTFWGACALRDMWQNEYHDLVVFDLGDGIEKDGLEGEYRMDDFKVED